MDAGGDNRASEREGVGHVCFVVAGWDRRVIWFGGHGWSYADAPELGFLCGIVVDVIVVVGEMMTLDHEEGLSVFPDGC